MADSFEEFRPLVLEYLQDKGINPRKRFRCLNPAHLDRNPSMGYDPKRHKVHCFACGADYDLFDLLAIDEGLSSPGEALAEAARRYGRGEPKRPPSPPRPAEAPPAGGEGYFARRGLSAETARRFSLRYDPERDCVVIPC